METSKTKINVGKKNMIYYFITDRFEINFFPDFFIKIVLLLPIILSQQWVEFILPINIDMVSNWFKKIILKPWGLK